MEVSALRHRGVALRGPTPLLRLQGDERLVALTRRGNQAAYEVLVARYQARLLAFCRHMLASREDAEDVLQEVFAAAFNAMIADTRPINVRPWLYRIARNRCLNHLRRQQAIGVDSMDIHLADHGTTTADRVHKREDFRELVGDVQELPETQRTALLLREIDALSYEQVAEAMDTTVPAVKSLLVRARVSLAEAAEARRLTCEDVRVELGEVAEGLAKRTPAVRRHLRTCDRCAAFEKDLKHTSKALAAVFPLGPLVLLKSLVTHGAAGSAAGAAGGAAAVGGSGAFGAGATAVAAKAAAGLAAAAIVGVGAVEVDHVRRTAPEREHRAPVVSHAAPTVVAPRVVATTPQPTTRHATPVRTPSRPTEPAAAAASTPATTTAPATPPAAATETTETAAPTQTHTDTTVLPASGAAATVGPAPMTTTAPTGTTAPPATTTQAAPAATTPPAPSTTAPATPPATTAPPTPAATPSQDAPVPGDAPPGP